MKGIELKQRIICVYITTGIVGESKTKKGMIRREEEEKNENENEWSIQAKPLHETLKTKPWMSIQRLNPKHGW